MLGGVPGGAGPWWPARRPPKEAKQQVDEGLTASGSRTSGERDHGQPQFDVASDEKEVLKGEDNGADREVFHGHRLSPLLSKEAGPDGYSASRSLAGWPAPHTRSKTATGRSNLSGRGRSLRTPSTRRRPHGRRRFNEKLPEVINKINQLSYKTSTTCPERRPEVQVDETYGPDLTRHPAPKLTVYRRTSLETSTRCLTLYVSVGQLSYYNKMPEILE